MLMFLLTAKAVDAVFRALEQLANIGMAQRFARCVGQQVLFRDIGDIFRLVILGEQMVIGLILARPDFRRD